MSVLEAIKAVFARVLRALAEGLNRLAVTEVFIEPDGSLHVQESLAERIGDKIAAILLAATAALVLYLPVSVKWSGEAADQLFRTATRLWSGGLSESV